jgi:hypothetical protein
VLPRCTQSNVTQYYSPNKKIKNCPIPGPPTTIAQSPLQSSLYIYSLFFPPFINRIRQGERYIKTKLGTPKVRREKRVGMDVLSLGIGSGALISPPTNVRPTFPSLKLSFQIRSNERLPSTLNRLCQRFRPDKTSRRVL